MGFDKRQLYETDIRVPLIVSGPGIPRASMANAIVQHVDLGVCVCVYVGVGVWVSVGVWEGVWVWVCVCSSYYHITALTHPSTHTITIECSRNHLHTIS